MSTMPTPNRPFFGSFLAAFRVHNPASLPQKPASPSAATTRQPAAAAAAPPPATTPQTRSLTTRALPATATAAAVAIASQSQFGAARTGYANAKASAASVSASPSHAAPAPAPSQPIAMPMPLTPLQARGRRGSDSSTEGGFRDVAAEGGGKWYIGGRTRGGEERVYKLAMVRRPRSIDRLSLDRLSL